MSSSLSSGTTNVSQLNDLRSYSRHWLGEFIDLYQAEQCLWQPKHPDYSNHNERNKAYDKLVEKLKEVEPNPDRAMVVRKINSLRSAFRREYRKSTTKPNYETRLWYYDKLLFIADQNPKRPANGSIENIKPEKRTLTFEEDDSMEFENDEQNLDGSASQTDHQTDSTTTLTVTPNCVTLVKSEGQHQQSQAQSEHEHLHHTHQQQQHHHHHHHQQQQSVSQTQQPSQHTAVKVLEITSLDSNSQREIQQAVSSLEHQHHMQQQLQQHQSGTTTTAQIAQLHHSQVPTIQIAREHLQPLFGNSTYSTATTTHRQEDEYDAIGFNVASKLRVMTPTQRIIAEKLIGDVLFNGQLDNLSINSALSH